jgi:hypothetical protein
MAHGKKLSPKKRQMKKDKPSTTKRYDGRKEKRTKWEEKNPTMIPGAINKPASLKGAFASPSSIDEKKIDDAKEMLAEQKAATEAA